MLNSHGHCHGAVDALDNEGRTALYMASQHGHSAVVMRLIRARANPNQPRYALDDPQALFQITFMGYLIVGMAY